jgi:hypothetical protein
MRGIKPSLSRARVCEYEPNNKEGTNPMEKHQPTIDALVADIQSVADERWEEMVKAHEAGNTERELELKGTVMGLITAKNIIQFGKLPRVA